MHRTTLLGVTVVVGIGIAGGAYLTMRSAPPATATPTRIRVKRVDNGHKVTLKGGAELVYAGIRAPHAREPGHDTARQRNAELVNGRKVRIRYDVTPRDHKGRLLGYVTIDERMVNEILVREGLAYVRLTPNTQRYATSFLAAQSAARSDGIGLWSTAAPAPEARYIADPRHGNFHRPTCSEVTKIKSERIVEYTSRHDALDVGMAPCAACRP